MKEMGPAARIWRLYQTGGLRPALTSMFDAQSAQQMAYLRSMMKEKREQSLFQTKLTELNAVVFDLETTGFSAFHGDSIISIGAVRVTGGTVNPTETFYRVVNPERPIPPDIERLTGITTAEASQTPLLIDGLNDFFAFTGRCLLIAHGTGHDKAFLQSALWRTSRAKLTHRMLDTMLVEKWLRPGVKELDLDGILKHYKIPIGRRHHALEDAVMTAQLWSVQLQKAIDKGTVTLGDLYTGLSTVNP